MSAVNKLDRFAELLTFSNTIQPTLENIKNQDFDLKGNWNSQFYKNDNPIILELGCGRGEYTLALANKYSDNNYLGVDIKGARIWKGAKEAMNNDMTNVGFLRTKIDFIDSFFGKNEIDEVWLTFSDPQRKKPRKRLTSPLFIERYKNFIKPKGIIHLKTDSTLLYEYTLNQVKKEKYNLILESDDIYANLHKFDIDMQEILSTKTFYEDMFSAQGYKIKYISFSIS